MHDGMPYGRNQGQGQGHSREVDRQSPTGLILFTYVHDDAHMCTAGNLLLVSMNLSLLLSPVGVTAGIRKSIWPHCSFVPEKTLLYVCGHV